jgi:hypothetical protein
VGFATLSNVSTSAKRFNFLFAITNRSRFKIQGSMLVFHNTHLIFVICAKIEKTFCFWTKKRKY